MSGNEEVRSGKETKYNAKSKVWQFVLTKFMWFTLVISAFFAGRLSMTASVSEARRHAWIMEVRAKEAERRSAKLRKDAWKVLFGIPGQVEYDWRDVGPISSQNAEVGGVSEGNPQ